MRINMKTISDNDWTVIHAAVRKVIDSTLSRGERQKLLDVLARVDGFIPFDDTIPQNTEGSEIFRASIGAMGAVA
jgi:hypothetical protein